jgi:hypothetical protein
MVAEPVDVAPHGALGDAQAFGELGARPRRPLLQQREQAQEATRGVGGLVLVERIHEPEDFTLCGPNVSAMSRTVDDIAPAGCPGPER